MNILVIVYIMLFRFRVDVVIWFLICHLLYKVALGKCFEEEQWGLIEWCIMAKHFECPFFFVHFFLMEIYGVVKIYLNCISNLIFSFMWTILNCNLLNFPVVPMLMTYCRSILIIGWRRMACEFMFYFCDFQPSVPFILGSWEYYFKFFFCYVHFAKWHFWKHIGKVKYV